MADPGEREPGLEIVIGEGPRTVLYAERLRDGRVALGTRRQEGEDWVPGELHFLDPAALVDLAGWLAPAVADAWREALRARQADPLRTAAELYQPGREGARRLAADMLAEIPPEMLARAMTLLANSIGPESRNRLVQHLNRTPSRAEDEALRRRMADESEAFAYAVAAAALFDAIASGALDDEPE